MDNKPKPVSKLRNVLIDVSANVAFTDGGDAVTKMIAQVMQESIPEAVLQNICKYCGPTLTRAAQKEMHGKLLNRILKHPNLDVTAAYNKNYRGALGIPKRYNKTKIKNYFKEALTVEVSACGYGERAFARSIKVGTRAGSAARAVSLTAARKQSTAKSISVYIKKLVKEAYKETAFRTGGRKRVAMRNWLIEADTGNPKNSGWGVFPGPGESLEFLDRRKRSDVQTNNSSQPNFSRYSRSGTHIMVRGRQYDPNDWRPEPDVSNVIEKIIIAGLPRVLRAAEKAVPQCLNRIKARLGKDAERIAKKRLSKENKLAFQIKGGGEAGQKALSNLKAAPNQRYEAVESSDIEDINIERSLQEIAIETKKTTIQLRTEINAILKVSQGRLTVQQIIFGIRKKIGLDR